MRRQPSDCMAAPNDEGHGEEKEPWNREVDNFARALLIEGKGCCWTEINQQDNPQHKLFHGCYDWHSATHGHWALLDGLSYLAHSIPTDEALKKRLDEVGERIERLAGDEVDTLVKAPEFEMPYGRAWFLLLLVRHSQVRRYRGGPASALTSRGQTVADSLWAHLSRSEFTLEYASVSEYVNPCWSLIQLWEWSTHRQNIAGQAEDDAQAYMGVKRRIAEVVQQCFFPKHDELGGFVGSSHWHLRQGGSEVVEVTSGSLTAEDLFARVWCSDGTTGFFSIWAVQCLLILRVLGPEALKEYFGDASCCFRGRSQSAQASAAERSPFDETLAPLPVHEGIIDGSRKGDVHLLAINASRAWGFYALWAAIGREGFRTAHRSHIRASMQLHTLSEEDWGEALQSEQKRPRTTGNPPVHFWRYAYLHWVPQFILYAILMEKSIYAQWK